MSRSHPLQVAAWIALSCTLVAAQGSGGGAPQGSPSGLAAGVTREAMWPAPSAEDWKKPCLITFQRTWDDALAVAQETHRPILICVNMDGEVASEHYAGIRYRQPDKAALYEPYVCVIASVYRHNPRDYDDQGRRILCPRFGSVTCGEHIAIEPLLYEKFMDKKRIAPRHIAVELAQGEAEAFDVYYAWDTDSVFQAIREEAARQPAPIPLVHGDQPLEQRVASRDVLDRTAVETAYLAGDKLVRRKILESALTHKDLDEIEILRLALFGLDADLARLARRALAESSSERAIDLIVEALRVPLDASERDMLLAALERLGETYPRAKTLAVVQQGLTRPSETLDVERWSQALAGAEYPAPKDWVTIEANVEHEEKSTRAAPADPAAELALAEAALALAVDPKTAQILAADYRTASAYSRLQFEDVRRAAREAERLGAQGWRLDAVLALSSYYLGDSAEAHARAEAAVKALPSGETSWNAMAVLALFALARQETILSAVRQRNPWPPQWLSDVNAAYSVLAHHPLGADYQVAAHFDFLSALGAHARAAQVLDAGLERFPDSWLLHARLRARSLEERGVEGLEAAYATRMQGPDPSPNLEWFAGYAGLVTAEYYRRAGNRSEAGAAYERAIAHYERSIAKNAASRPSADHYVALALAGRARMALEGGDLERALAEIEASFARRPEAAAALDGLNISPVDTANMLLARLREARRPELAKRLEDALASLDPELLKLPAYERDLPDARPRRPGR